MSKEADTCKALFVAAVAAVCLVGSPSESRAEQMWDWDGETFSFYYILSGGGIEYFERHDGDYGGIIKVFQAKSFKAAAGIARGWVRGMTWKPSSWYYYPPTIWNGFEIAPERYYFYGTPHNPVLQNYSGRSVVFTLWHLGGDDYMVHVGT